MEARSRSSSEADLQRKSDRPYFQETAKLPAGQVYLSSIDANVENGVVVRPYETTVRAGSPIFTKGGDLFGIIVANAAADSWLHDLSELSGLAGASGRFLAANQNGDYVYRSDGGPLFGSLDGSKAAFERDWPALRELFKVGAVSTTAVRKGEQFIAAHRVDYNPEKPHEFLVMATDVDATTVFGNTLNLILLGAAIALALALIGLIATYFVTRPLKGLMSAARKIAAGKLDLATLEKFGPGTDIGEFGEALRIMKDAVETRDASLRKSQADLQAIIDNTIDGLITIDRRGTILRYNHGCEEIFGYTTDETIGQNVSMLMPEPDSARHDSYLERYARTGEARFIGVRREATGQHKDGRPIELEVAIAEIKVDDDVFFSGIVRDITERKKVERIKSEFVSTVTHELRTPLTSIMGSLGLLRAGTLGALPAKSRRMVNLAHDNGARLVALINDILDIDKIEAGQLVFKRQRANLKTLIEQAVAHNFAYAHQHGVSIVVEDIPNDIILVTDPDRFQQVMGNLLSNAAKFSPEGGQVTIAAKMASESVRISVVDHGPGIPEEFHSLVFQKFAQGDSSDTRQKGGTGLGLSISKAIVERMGGKIDFETQVGAGTMFFFDLPASRSEAAPIASSHAGSQLGHLLHVSHKRSEDSALPRVLHVEDDADTCAVLAESIADVANVTCVPTAEEAREILLTEFVRSHRSRHASPQRERRQRSAFSLGAFDAAAERARLFGAGDGCRQVATCHAGARQVAHGYRDPAQGNHRAAERRAAAGPEAQRLGSPQNFRNLTARIEVRAGARGPMLVAMTRTLKAPQRWAAVLARDKSFDGTFYYSVATTGVYCRPSCAARRPKRENVRFHATCADAEAAGFRPCKRCKPGAPALYQEHAAKVARACRRIEAAEADLSLADLAKDAGLSPYHFHRIFKAVTGVTPKAYVVACRHTRVRDHLKRSRSVTEAIFDCRIQFQRPLLCRRFPRPRHGALLLPRRRHRHRDPLCHQRMLAGGDPGCGDQRGRRRDPDGRQASHPGTRPAAAVCARQDRRRRQTFRSARRQGDRPRGGAGDVPRPAARRARDRVPAPRVGGAARHPGGHDGDLRRDCRAHRRAQGHARRGRRLRRQPVGRGHPLSPCRAQRRRPFRLSLGRRPQARTAQKGGDLQESTPAHPPPDRDGLTAGDPGVQ